MLHRMICHSSLSHSVMVVVADSEDVSSLSGTLFNQYYAEKSDSFLLATKTVFIMCVVAEVLYKSLRSTVRSMIRWLLKCSNVSPPPT